MERGKVFLRPLTIFWIFSAPGSNYGRAQIMDGPGQFFGPWLKLWTAGQIFMDGPIETWMWLTTNHTTVRWQPNNTSIYKLRVHKLHTILNHVVYCSCDRSEIGSEAWSLDFFTVSSKFSNFSFLFTVSSILSLASGWRKRWTGERWTGEKDELDPRAPRRCVEPLPWWLGVKVQDREPLLSESSDRGGGGLFRCWGWDFRRDHTPTVW